MPRSFDLLFEDLPVAACAVEVPSRAIVGWNRAASELFGFAGQEPGSLTLFDRIQPWNTVAFEEALRAGDFHSAEFRGVTGFNHAGAPVLLDLAIAKSERDGKPVFLITFVDVAARVHVEEQLRQSQKMESMGMLAGGIAHDFNNLLTIISGYGHMLAMSLENDENGRFAADQVIKASDRAASLTRQLLAFSRRQAAQSKILDLNAVVQGITPMLNRIIGEHIRLRIAPGKELGRVRADSGQIEQVIMNLVVNARDAMPQGGTLWIETGNVTLDADAVPGNSDFRAGEFVMLAVTDTGIGMNAETREKIFEPFFTTKESGKGTGLGLSMVFDIVKRSGGIVNVYSEPGQGTAFKVYLQRNDSQDAVAQADPVPAPVSGTETILLVEDEEAVRNIVRVTLEARGYRLLVAESGEDAMQMLKEHDGKIDLLITDMVLPKMNGREVARRLHRKQPLAEVLFMSGYTDVTLSETMEPDKQLHFIGKPFTPAVLTRYVRQLLDGRRVHASRRNQSGH